MFEYICQQLINGISIGSIYALIALGYTMVYGIIKLINFAHGDVFMVGAFVGYYCATAGMNLFLSLVIAMVACALLGMLIERLADRPLRNAARSVILLTHAYLASDGKRFHGHGQPHAPANFRTAQSPEGANDGEALWQKLVSKHANFAFVMVRPSQ